MPTINPSLPSDGDDAVVAPYNAAIQAILAVINGSIDEDNLAANAVILSKLSAAVQAALVPAGTILAYGGSAAPTGFLLCYGQAVSRSTYSDLFAIVGTSFGAGNGTTTFNLPDLRGRLPMGNDAMGGTAANTTQRSTTINTTNGSPTATVASATDLNVGMYVVSTNVPAGTTISAISGTTLTLSANATATASTVAARFSNFTDAQTLGAIGGSVKTGAHKHFEFAAETATTVALTSVNQVASGRNTGNDFSYGIDNGGSSLAATVGLSSSTGNGPEGSSLNPAQVVNYMIKT